MQRQSAAVVSHISMLVSVGAIASATLLNAANAQAFTITENVSNNSAARTALLNNLLGDQTGLSNFSISLVGDRRAFGTFSNDPFGLTSGVVMSTGKVQDLVGPNTKDGTTVPGQDLSTDFGAAGASGDDITMTIRFDADNTVSNLYFQYVFGSEELVEFGGSSFNDAFTLRLNGFNYARLSDDAELNINNLAPTKFSYHPDLRLNPVGTGPAANLTRLDGYTFPLLYVAPVNPGEQNILTLNIKDVGDEIFDSAIFIKGGTLSSKAPAPIIIDGVKYAGPKSSPDDPNPIPTPALLPGLIGFATNIWRKRHSLNL